MIDFDTVGRLSMDFLVRHAVFLAATASLIVTLLATMARVEAGRLFRLSVALAVVTTVLCLQDYLFVLVFFPYALIVPASLLTIAFLSITKHRSAKTYARIVLGFNVLFLFVGLELLKSPGTTWGNSAMYVGIFLVVNVLMILQLLTHAFRMELACGICKLVFGVASLLVIWFAGDSAIAWKGEGTVESLSRIAACYLSFVLIVEGALLVRRAGACSKAR